MSLRVVWKVLGRKRIIGGVYLPTLSKIEGEWKYEQFTCWEYSCAVYKPILPRDTGSIQEERKLLSNLFVWF